MLFPVINTQAESPSSASRKIPESRHGTPAPQPIDRFVPEGVGKVLLVTLNRVEPEPLAALPFWLNKLMMPFPAFGTSRIVLPSIVKKPCVEPPCRTMRIPVPLEVEPE